MSKYLQLHTIRIDKNVYINQINLSHIYFIFKFYMNFFRHKVSVYSFSWKIIKMQILYIHEYFII